MEYGACRVVIKWGSRCQPRTNPTADNLRKGLKQSFGMDKTGRNPPTRRDHLIPPVPRAKQLPPAGTNTNQKGCLVVTRRNQAEAQHSAKQASKPAASSTKRAKRASVQKQNKGRPPNSTPDPPPRRPGPRPVGPAHLLHEDDGQ